LFSESHFERRAFQTSKDVPIDYKDFVGQQPLGKRDKGVDCLARGVSTGADKFISWLVSSPIFVIVIILTSSQEKSVFHAMEREYLECFQLRIFEDPQCPDEVLETWTFKITYPDEKGRAPEVAGINIERKNAQSVTLADARDNLRDTVKAIYNKTNMMRYLPSKTILQRT